ncbi:MAG: hypothetical protein LUB56_01335 [Coprobacillus sp.]|nr:hypothetical protein [Coprobacillus sp.]
MKSSLKKISLTVAVIALSLTATSCGSKDDGKIHVIFWHTFGQGIQDRLDDIISRFEKDVYDNEGVEVVVEPVYKGGYDDIFSNINQGWSADSVPTIAVAYADHVADYINSEGKDGEHVVNLDKYINDPEVGFGKEKWLGDTEEGLDDFIPAYIEEGTSFAKEGTYLLPLMKSTEVMFYNKDCTDAILDQMTGVSEDGLKEGDPYYIDTNGLTYDQYLSQISWDELMKIGEFAADENLWTNDRLSTDFVPVVYDSDGNLFITKMYQNEIPYSSVNYETKKGSIDFEEGEAREAAEEMVSELLYWHDEGVLETKGTLGEYGSNYFIDQEAIFSIGSSGGAGYNFPTTNDFEVGVCTVPADNDNPIYVCQGPSITLLRNPALSDEVNDERNYYGWKFMKYLTNVDVNIELCTYGSEGYSPVRYSAYETDEYMEYLKYGENYAQTAQVVLDIIDSYFMTPSFPGSATLRDQAGGIITDVLSHNNSVSAAFDNAINQAKLSM